MEIKKGQIIYFPDTVFVPSVVRAKSFRITSGMGNFAQYVKTVKAYALAGMPLEHIANAGDHLGDLVERGEIDASLLQTSQSKAGEIAEDENRIMAWQNRGEIISITPQLSSPTSTGAELVTTSQQLSADQESDQTRNVLEGIAVFNQADDSQLEGNPYLKAPADLKKAA